MTNKLFTPDVIHRIQICLLRKWTRRRYLPVQFRLNRRHYRQMLVELSEMYKQPVFICEDYLDALGSVNINVGVGQVKIVLIGSNKENEGMTNDNKMYQEKFISHGLNCYIIQRSPTHMCGYVDVDANSFLAKLDHNYSSSLEVHGGITWNGSFKYAGTEVYALGFDTGHSGDWWPQFTAKNPLSYIADEPTIWTVDKLREEVISLAKQVSEFIPPLPIPSVDTKAVEKGCSTCKYTNNDSHDYPCSTCGYLVDRTDNWEAKE